MISLDPGFLLIKNITPSLQFLLLYLSNSWRVLIKKTVKDFTSFVVADKNRWIGCLTKKKSVLKV